MNAYTVKGNVSMVSGRLLQSIGHYTGNNRLYLSGVQKEWWGKALRNYGRVREAVKGFKFRS